MKNKLKFLVNMSLKRKIKTKWFLIANIILAVGIMSIVNIDNIINFFGGDFNSKTKIYIVDNANAYDLFIASSKNYLNDEYEIIKSDSNDVTSNLEKEKSSIVLVFNESENIIDVEMISNEYLDTIEMNLIKTSLNSVKTSLAIIKHNISQDQINDLTGEVNIERKILNEDKSSDEENMSMIMTTLFPIVIMPIYMLIIYLVQMVGAEINDEKTTRGMEIIIANVSPKTHFFSKCIAGNLFVLIQASLLILYLILGFVLRGAISPDSVGIITEVANKFNIPVNFLSSLKYIIPLVLVLTILNFIGYSLLAGILASVTTNSEDFQQLQTPIIILSFIGYYLAITATTFNGSIFIKLLGYMPFISGILSPSLLLIGDFTIFNVLISIIIMILVIYLLIKYGLRIYKVGILNYSSGNLWKKMLGALK